VANRVLPSLYRIFSGDLTIFGGPSLEEAAAGRIRAEQVNVIKQYLPWMMLANAFNAVVLVAALWKSPDQSLALGWASLIVGFAALQGRKGGGASGQSRVSERTVRRAVGNAFLLGSLWAALPVTFFDGASSSAQLVITCLCAGTLGGGALAFASIPAAAIAFAIPIFVGSGIAIAHNDDHAYWLVAMLMVVYTCILLRGVFLHAFGLLDRLLAQLKAEAEARTDPLTKLPNRVSFHHDLQRALARLARYGEGFAVLYLDVDEFKAVNDRFGHASGDELLAQIAGRLLAAVRAIDVIARLSGDEFAILAANVSAPKQALAVAERVMRSLDAPFMIDQHEVSNAISIGIAVAPGDGGDAETLLRNADQALYRAKNEAPGSARFWRPEHDAIVADDAPAQPSVVTMPRRSAA
jgi:diguanylate cyclase (GGDEF)-like protein